MIRQGLRIGFVLACLAASGSAADALPPVKCGKRNAGQFWPEAANTDRTVRNRAEKCGSLLYCGRATFGWKWQPMTVSIQSLIAKAHGEQSNPACTAGFTQKTVSELK